MLPTGNPEEPSLLNICLKIMGVYYALSALNTLPASILQTVMFWNAGQYNRQNDPVSRHNDQLQNRFISRLTNSFSSILLLFADHSQVRTNIQLPS